MTVELTIGAHVPYALVENPDQQEIALHCPVSGNAGPLGQQVGSLRAKRLSEDKLILDGDLEGKPFRAELQKMALSSGFHWIFFPPKEEK